MVVGPSAPPMIPIEAASPGRKPNRAWAPIAATKTPSWAAAPSMNVIGRASRGRKSVSAPTPRKITGGRNSVRIPAS
jgi:hypothetical protein